MKSKARQKLRLIIVLAAICLTVLSVFKLEQARTGLEISDLSIGTTPATLYREQDSKAPLVVIAHGFAGSRQFMEPFSLTLARAGYQVLAFDFEGHGRNPVPMSGDVTSIDGTTAKLVAETRRVIEAGLDLTGDGRQVALLGHSMATDVIIRAAQGDPRIKAIVAVSMFSEAVDATYPENLLMLTGAWEPWLRETAMRALRQIDPQAREGDTARSGEIKRRAVVAPGVEHIGVLYSPTSLKEARDWIDTAYGRESSKPVAAIGPWIGALLVSLVILFRPLSRLLPQSQARTSPISSRRFLAALVAPALIAPVFGSLVYSEFLPVLVADYLMIHLALYGVIQLAVLRVPLRSIRAISLMGTACLVIWGVGIFGLALDRYAASFFPTENRLLLIAILTMGTIPFMIADAFVTEGGRSALWHRVAARITVFASLTIAVALAPEQLGFVVTVFPMLILFFVVHGLMGRWIAQRSGPATAGLGLGLVLAWALGVSFPLFASG